MSNAPERIWVTEQPKTRRHPDGGLHVCSVKEKGQEYIRRNAITPAMAAEVLDEWLNSENPNARMVAGMFDGLRKAKGSDFDRMCAALRAIATQGEEQ